MATITSQEINETGLNNPTFTAASATGDKWENSGTEFIAIKNATGGDPLTITFTATTTSFTSPTYGPSTKSNATIAIAGGNTGFIGPFEAAAFNDEDGFVDITYSDHTTLSIAVFTLSSN